MAQSYSPVTTVAEVKGGRALIRASQLQVRILDLLASAFRACFADGWTYIDVSHIDLLVSFEPVPKRRRVI